MDVVCKAVTTDMDTWSAFAVGLHLSSANIALWGGGGGGGGILSQKAPFDCPKKIERLERHQPMSNSFLDSGWSTAL